MTWSYKSPLDLTLSETGVEMLKQYEGDVPGVYNDSKGYATFGIGSLIQKRNSILLRLAKGSNNDFTRKYVKTNKRTGAPFLDMGASEDADFAKRVADLGKRSKGEAKAQIEEEWSLLSMDWDDYLQDRFATDVEAKMTVSRGTS
jgi:hypothetical protein